MRRRSDLPPALLRGPFLVRNALALGVPARRLDGSDLTAPTSGVRVPAHLPESLRLTCEAVALVLPETAAWSHLTALELCGIPLPGDALLQAPDRRPRVPEASVPPGVAPPRRQGVRGREGLDPASVCQWRGLRVVHPLTAWGTVGTRLPLDALVAAGDALVRQGWSRLDQLVLAAASLEGRRGARRVRAAAALVRVGADSAPETALRLLLVRAGLPEPVLQHTVLDPRTGRWVARPDLSYPDLLIAIEYDGAHHVERRQWRHDLVRNRRLEELGWRVLVVTAEDLRERPAEVARWVAAAVAARCSA